MNNKNQIEKLNNSNYFSWKYQMELTLISEELWDVTENARGEIQGRALERWIKKDNKARALIGLAVEKDQLVHIRDKLNAFDTWNSLKAIHEKDTLTNKISLYKKIAQFKLKKGDKIEEHLNELVSMFQKLQNLGAVIDEHWKIGMVLASLPSSYAPLVTALEARNEIDLSFNLIQMKILDEFQRQRENSDDDESKIIEEKVFQIKKGKMYCYFCKRDNHNMDSCFKLKQYKQFQEFEQYIKQKEQKDQKNKKEEVNEIETFAEEEEIDLVLSLVVDDEKDEKIPFNSSENQFKMIALMKQLLNFKIENKVNIEKEINSFLLIFDEIKLVDKELSANSKISFILNALPEKYQYFTVRCELVETKLNWEKFLNILFEEIEKLIESEAKCINKNTKLENQCNDQKISLERPNNHLEMVSEKGKLIIGNTEDSATKCNELLNGSSQIQLNMKNNNQVSLTSPKTKKKRATKQLKRTSRKQQAGEI